MCFQATTADAARLALAALAAPPLQSSAFYGSMHNISDQPRRKSKIVCRIMGFVPRVPAVQVPRNIGELQSTALAVCSGVVIWKQSKMVHGAATLLFLLSLLYQDARYLLEPSDSDDSAGTTGRVRISSSGIPSSSPSWLSTSDTSGCTSF